MKTVPAVVLAGGGISGELAAMTGASRRAMIPLAGRPMVAHVLRALRGAKCISRIALVGPEDIWPAVDSSLYDIRAPSGAGLAESLFSGLQCLEANSETLTVTGDLPLLTPEAVDDFVSQALSSGADVNYSIIPKHDCAARFPGGKRTYVRTKEGIFTGGNCTLLRADVIAEKEDLIRRLYQARKSIVRLAAVLGPSFVWRLAFGGLSIADVERRAAQILGVKAKAIVSHYPEIGFDVDKPVDLEMVRRMIEGQSTRPTG